VILNERWSTSLTYLLLIILLIQCFIANVRIGRVLPSVIESIFSWFCLLCKTLLCLSGESGSLAGSWVQRGLDSLFLIIVLIHLFLSHRLTILLTQVLAVGRAVREAGALLFSRLLVSIFIAFINLRVLLGGIDVVIITAVHIVLPLC
jgi:hypothetical protein